MIGIPVMIFGITVILCGAGLIALIRRNVESAILFFTVGIVVGFCAFTTILIQ